MGYHASDHMVRADFFKPGGKWGYTEAIDMCGLWHAKSWDLRLAIALAAKDLHPEHTIVVLAPYHELSHPIMLSAELRVELLVEWAEKVAGR